MAYQAGMGGMGEMEGRGRKESLGHVERRETEERWGHREPREYQDSRDHLEFLAPRGQWEKKVIVGTQVCLDLKESRAHQQEGQSTLAGG